MKELIEVKLTDLPDLDVNVEPWSPYQHEKMLRKERDEHAKRITESPKDPPPKTDRNCFALPCCIL